MEYSSGLLEKCSNLGIQIEMLVVHETIEIHNQLQH